ncbi:MAG: GT2 family glycosyltransferase [Planctomycetota bacterium]|jgi:GT2 family glycosyltransferase
MHTGHNSTESASMDQPRSVLAWPNWSRAGALEQLWHVFARQLLGRQAHLQLIFDAELDGELEEAQAAMERAHSLHLGECEDLEVSLIVGPFTPEELEKAAQTAAAVLDGPACLQPLAIGPTERRVGDARQLWSLLEHGSPVDPDPSEAGPGFLILDKTIVGSDSRADRLESLHPWRHAAQLDNVRVIPGRGSIQTAEELIVRDAQTRQRLVEQLLQHVDMRGMHILDVDCGCAYWSAEYVLAGAQRVVGLAANARDLEQAELHWSRANLRPPGGYQFLEGTPIQGRVRRALAEEPGFDLVLRVDTEQDPSAAELGILTKLAQGMLVLDFQSDPTDGPLAAQLKSAGFDFELLDPHSASGFTAIARRTASQEHTQQKPREQAMQSSSPELTVVIPTYGRSKKLFHLLDLLGQQTLPNERFECIVVDDGSPEPVQLDVQAYPYDLKLIRRGNGGPAAARNSAIEHTRGTLTLYLNDDTVPALDLLANHIAAHRTVGAKTLVLGTFNFTKEAMGTGAFMQILQGTSLLFNFEGLKENTPLGWGFCWTCNLSMPTAALREVGGFDEQLFDSAIVEDVELGYRLEQLGYEVRHFKSCRAEHNHRLSITDYLERSERLGYYLTRMWAKHNEPSMLWASETTPVQDVLEKALDSSETFRPALKPLIAAMEQFEMQSDGVQLDQATIEQFDSSIRDVSMGPWFSGVHRAQTGVASMQMASKGAPKGARTTIVMISYNALSMTQDCIESLRRNQDADWPTELVVVDNGSTDGSAEWLAAQPDVELIANAENRGAPAARNQALARGYGDWVCFLDNDIVVTEGWLERAHYHGAVDPRVGCICFVAQRASKDQQVAYSGDGSPEQLEAFSKQRLQDFHRKGRDTSLFASFGVLVRNKVIETIGGFDERFSPWGFEDDDFALRSMSAGFKNRVAQDVFVYHAPYPDAAKGQRHANHMQANWEAFVTKWGPQDLPMPQLFDYTNLNLKTDSKPNSGGLFEVLSNPRNVETNPAPAASPIQVALGNIGATAPGFTSPEVQRESTLEQSGQATVKPKLSVVIVTSSNCTALGRCLASLEDQDVEPGWLELIIVNNGSEDETAHYLDQRTFAALSQIIHRQPISIGAARNLGAVSATGDIVLFLDDTSVAQPGLVRAHIATHTQDGATPLYVQGTYASPERNPADALTEALQNSSALYPFTYLDPRALHDWTGVFSSNVSFSSQAIRQADGFDEELNCPLVVTAELAFRLQQAGYQLRYDPLAKAISQISSDLGELAAATRSSATSWAQFLKRTPAALQCERWGWINSLEPAALSEQLARKEVRLSALENSARSLADLDLGALTQSGLAGTEFAKEAACHLEGVFMSMERIWHLQGLVRGLEDLDRSERARMPMELTTNAQHKVLAWPHYHDDSDLEKLFSEYGQTLCDVESTCLCLRHDADLDGPLDDAVNRLQDVYERILGNRDLEVLFINNPLTPDEVTKLGNAVLATVELRPHDPTRTAFLTNTGAHIVPAPPVLERLLRGAP